MNLQTVYANILVGTLYNSANVCTSYLKCLKTLYRAAQVDTYWGGGGGGGGGGVKGGVMDIHTGGFDGYLGWRLLQHILPRYEDLFSES